MRTDYERPTLENGRPILRPGEQNMGCYWLFMVGMIVFIALGFIFAQMDENKIAGARAKLDEGKIEAAEKVARELTSKEGGGLNEAYVLLGEVLEKKGDYAAMQQVSDQLLKNSPNFPNALALKARVLFRHGKLNEAEEAAHAAIEKDPRSLVAHLALAEIYVASNKLKEAHREAALVLDSIDRNSKKAKEILKATESK